MWKAGEDLKILGEERDCEQIPTVVDLVIDQSSSLSIGDLEVVWKGVKQLVGKLKSKIDRFAVVTFGSTVSERIQMQNVELLDNTHLRECILAPSNQGNNSALMDALDKGYDLIEKDFSRQREVEDERKKVMTRFCGHEVVIISNGMENSSTKITDPRQIRNRLRESKIPNLHVTFLNYRPSKNQADMNRLNTMMRSKDCEIIKADNAKEMKKKLTEISNSIIERNIASLESFRKGVGNLGSYLTFPKRKISEVESTSGITFSMRIKKNKNNESDPIMNNKMTVMFQFKSVFHIKRIKFLKRREYCNRKLFDFRIMRTESLKKKKNGEEEEEEGEIMKKKKKTKLCDNIDVKVFLEPRKDGWEFVRINPKCTYEKPKNYHAYIIITYRREDIQSSSSTTTTTTSVIRKKKNKKEDIYVEQEEEEEEEEERMIILRLEKENKFLRLKLKEFSEKLGLSFVDVMKEYEND